MTSTGLKIAIVGAGFAGISTARVLSELGHDVLVYEKAPDVGGVWSATRRYPGLKTQNNKGTYALSEMPMPAHYPEWPSGEQVQQYLRQYAEKFGLLDRIHCNTEVVDANPAPTGGWNVTTNAGTVHVDHLVLASGIFSEPFVPDFPGVDDFAAAGGEVLPAGDLHTPPFFSKLSAEVSALWIGSFLGGNHTLPSDDDMRAVTERLAWVRERTRGQHARGTNAEDQPNQDAARNFG